MINFKKYLFIFIIIIFFILQLNPDNKKYKDIEVKYKYRLKIPENWFFEEYTEDMFNVYNNDFKNINNQVSLKKLKSIKVEGCLYSSAYSFNEVVEEQLEIYDNVIKKEEFKMDNGIIGISYICESIPPNYNDLFIVYHDGFKSVIIYCWPSYTEHKEDFYKIVKSFNFIYYTPTNNNLNLNVYTNFDSKFLRKLIKGEKLELIEKGKADTVNGVKGTWVKVKTEKGEVGWCFDAYLEEIKN